MCTGECRNKVRGRGRSVWGYERRALKKDVACPRFSVRGQVKREWEESV